MVSSLLGSLRPARFEKPQGEIPHEFDVVRLRVSVGGWPEGTEGTLIDALSDTHGLVEISEPGSDHLETVVVSYSAVTVVSSATAEHEPLAI